MNIRLLLLFLLYPTLAIGYKNRDVGIGGMANNLMDPVGIVTEFVVNGSIIIGVCFLFSAFLRYTRYRMNPLESPLSTVMVFILIGLILIGLPFVRKLL